jgi:excisionase family DNA binding protein
MSGDRKLNANRPLTLNQVSRRTGLPRDWRREQALAGRLPCLRVGDKFLFNFEAVQAALAELAAGHRGEAHGA